MKRIKLKQPERQIETNIGEQEFLKIITELKRKSQKGICSKLCLQEFIITSITL